MSEETINVAEVSAGVGGSDETEAGAPVDLPVVELLTGRGFVTGKSGSGKSNSASVIIEKLLDNRFSTLIVDTDGEYYGLKEEYEILHVGADEECDIVVSPEHAEKIAELALEQNIPIILDVSSFLDEDEAEELLLETTRHLFAKEKKLKKPFLMLVEECHEYIPEGGGLGEIGRMLIKVGKRGRKHGLGIVGISQRPADVKKDFITQCDWLVWHRLTWQNDTKVVGRILGSQYADAIEDLGDGEAFLVTDWSESLRRVQFHRKQTFDAGATPGLGDFERPELKSVSSDLVSELSDISDEKARRESEIADLKQELDKKRSRIQQLERELEEARDLSRMADKFAQAMLQKSGASYRGGTGRSVAQDDAAGRDAQRGLDEYDGSEGADGGSPDADAGDGAASAVATDEGHPGDPAADDDAAAPDRNGGRVVTPGREGATPTSRDAGGSEAGRRSGGERRSDADRGGDPTTDLHVDLDAGLGEKRPIVGHLRALVAELEPVSREMLAHYRREGPADPVDAHVAVGGSGDRHVAYSRNRPLRQTGLVEHDAGGRYAYALPDIVRETYADRLSEGELSAVVRAVEETFVEDVTTDVPFDGTRTGAVDDGDGDADERPDADDGSADAGATGERGYGEWPSHGRTGGDAGQNGAGSETSDDAAGTRGDGDHGGADDPGRGDGSAEVLKREDPAPAEKPDQLYGLETPDDAEFVETGRRDDAGDGATGDAAGSEAGSNGRSDDAEIIDQ
jgi:hypothetical protein